MKGYLIVATTALLLSGQLLAEQQTEDQCRGNVEAIISAIEVAQDSSGTAKSIQELGIKEIRDLQKSAGHCATLQELKERMAG